MATLGQCNSNSHKKEWDRFSRRRKIPAALKEKFQGDKLALFNIFLLNDGNLEKCVTYYEKVEENANKATKTWELLKKGDLKDYYTEACRENAAAAVGGEQGHENDGKVAEEVDGVDEVAEEEDNCQRVIVKMTLCGECHAAHKWAPR